MMNIDIKQYEKLNIEDEDNDQNFIMYKQNNKTQIKSIKKRRKLIKDNIIKHKTFVIIILFIVIILAFSILTEINENQESKIISNLIKNIINKSNLLDKEKEKDTKTDKEKEKDVKINKEKDIKTDKEKEKGVKTDKEKDIKTDKEKDVKTDKEKDVKTDKEKEKEIKEENKEKEEWEWEEKKPSNDDIYKKEYFDGFDTAFKKARSFLESNMNGEILHKEPFVAQKHPKISGIIPVYNCQDIITRAVRSIQNQNILNLEIILINDFSTDNTSLILEKLQKEDPRIKVLNNKKNMGILYSRSIGTLSAKSKYIFPLDNDDMFLDKDVFQIISDRADKGNFDIIEFRGVLTLPSKKNLFERRRIGTTFSPYGDNIVRFQPQLGAFPLQKGNKYGEYRLISVYLWSKCIKTKIYKKALNLLGKERYSRYMLRDEDLLVNYIIFNIAESFKFLGKYGIVHIQRDSSASVQPNYIQLNKQSIYVLEAALEFSKNLKENKEWIAYYTTMILNARKLEDTLKEEYVNKIFISCLDQIFKNQTQYFYDRDKEEIKKRVISNKFINYKF